MLVKEFLRTIIHKKVKICKLIIRNFNYTHKVTTPLKIASKVKIVKFIAKT